MKDVDGAYIISGSGAIIFSQENLESNGDFDLNYLSDFLSTIETIALNIGEDEVNVLEFGNIKFFHVKDRLTKIGFVIKSKKDVKPKKIRQVLTNLMNIFIEKFTGNFTSPDVVKQEKMENFIERIANLLGTGKKVEYFLDSIGY